MYALKKGFNITKILVRTQNYRQKMFMQMIKLSKHVAAIQMHLIN